MYRQLVRRTLSEAEKVLNGGRRRAGPCLCDSCAILELQVLNKDSQNIKAFFRRGTARMHLADFDAAKADLREAIRLDPKSKEIREAFSECTRRESEARKADKALFAKMVKGAGGEHRPLNHKTNGEGMDASTAPGEMSSRYLPTELQQLLSLDNRHYNG